MREREGLVNFKTATRVGTGPTRGDSIGEYYKSGGVVEKAGRPKEKTYSGLGSGKQGKHKFEGSENVIAR